jgi:hypothetical protein
MKFILIIFISIFSLNYSFGQMKVYAETDEHKNQYNSHLVGIIYSSGEVYKYKNGEEVLYGIVRDHRFFVYDQNYSEIQVGSYNKVPTMGAGGKIYIDVGNFNRTMIAFRVGGRYYRGDDIEDESSMMGFHIGDFLHGLDGSYAAAYFLIFDRK